MDYAQAASLVAVERFFVPTVFLFSLVIGSFLNVVIYRVPRNKSIVLPGSRCPQCNTPIAPYDNIPVVSYVILRGRCRHCRARIPARYPMVELLTALVLSMAAYAFGPSLEFILAAIFLSALIAVSFIDLDFTIIPNKITYTVTAIGLLLKATDDIVSLTRGRADFGWPELSTVQALLGLAVGWGSLWAIAFIAGALLKRQAMGGGDVKLAAMMGVYLGWKGLLLAFIIGSLSGSVIGLAGMIVKGKWERLKEIPFGPHLALGAWATLMFGREITNWYVSHFLR